MLRKGNSEKLIRGYLDRQGFKGTWELSEGKLVKDPPLGLDAYALAKRALKENSSLPESGLIPVLKRTNEKALTDMVKQAEGEFITVSGFRFFKPHQKLAKEWVQGNQSWDIIEKGITPTVIPIKVWGWDKQGKKLEGTRNKDSAVLHVDADIWEESGLATALQHLIDNPKTSTTGTSKTGIQDLARKVQREALSYRESDGARTNQKVLYRDKNLGTEAVPESEPAENTRQEEYYADDYDDALVEPQASDGEGKLGKASEGAENQFPDSEESVLSQAKTDLRQENADLANAGWRSEPEIIPEYPDWDLPSVSNKNPILNIGAFHGKTAEDLASFLAESSEVSPTVRAIAKAILPSLKGQRVLIDRNGMISPEGLKGGKYTHGLQEIQFGRNFTHAKTVLHELIHAATAHAIETNPEAHATLLEFQSIIREVANKDAAAGTLTEAQTKALKYILTGKDGGLQEVLTVAFTHPELQKYLASKTMPAKSTSIWKHFVNTIKKVLGLSIESNLLDEALRVGSKVIAANKEVLPPERVATQLNTLGTPRLTGYEPYLKALQDPVEATNALEALILNNSDMAPVYAEALTELHNQGGISQETLNKLLKGPCS
jgi:hypothetical protein